MDFVFFFWCAPILYHLHKFIFVHASWEDLVLKIKFCFDHFLSVPDERTFQILNIHKHKNTPFFGLAWIAPLSFGSYKVLPSNCIMFVFGNCFDIPKCEQHTLISSLHTIILGLWLRENKTKQNKRKRMKSVYVHVKTALFSCSIFPEPKTHTPPLCHWISCTKIKFSAHHFCVFVWWTHKFHFHSYCCLCAYFSSSYNHNNSTATIFLPPSRFFVSLFSIFG